MLGVSWMCLNMLSISASRYARGREKTINLANIGEYTDIFTLIMTGVFINFNVPYSKDGVSVLPQNQAEDILKKANDLVINGAKGVAITYSANYGQTREIEKAYWLGDWNTQTNGANQAAVVNCMEFLLGRKYSTLQGKMRILPITTMNAYNNPVNPF